MINVNPMKFVVPTLIVDENVYRNFGCVMVIGEKKARLNINAEEFASDYVF